MWNAPWLLGEKTRMRDCKWLWKWRRLSPLGSAEWRNILENVFLVYGYMLIWKVTPNPAMTAIFLRLTFILSVCFLFKTLLRRWVYRLFLRAPLRKVIMWHWNARRMETPLLPASTSTLRWEITGRVHSNHAGLSSPGSCSLPCILLYRFNYTGSLSLLALSRARRSQWWTRMSTLWLALPERTVAFTSAPCLTTIWRSPLSLSPWAVSGWTMRSVSLFLSLSSTH